MTRTSGTQPVFLTAEWRKLAMANYAADPAILRDYLPHSTELDLFNGTCYVSLVGFRAPSPKRFGGVRLPEHPFEGHPHPVPHRL